MDDMSGDRWVDLLVWLGLAGFFVAALGGCAARQLDPLPERAGDGITDEVRGAWASAQLMVIEAKLASPEGVVKIRPEWFQFHRVDVPFVCRTMTADGSPLKNPRKVRGCFYPRWNLVRYLDRSHSTLIHECIHAILWGLDIHEEDHELLDYP